MVTNGAQHIDAVHMGQMNVKQHKVRLELTEQLHGFIPVLRQLNAQAITLQIGRKNGGNARLVLDDKHQWH
ncbi:hypothetical protein D3C72_1146900 [compost metagenome]